MFSNTLSLILFAALWLEKSNPGSFQFVFCASGIRMLSSYMWMNITPKWWFPSAPKQCLAISPYIPSLHFLPLTPNRIQTLIVSHKTILFSLPFLAHSLTLLISKRWLAILVLSENRFLRTTCQLSALFSNPRTLVYFSIIPRHTSHQIRNQFLTPNAVAVLVLVSLGFSAAFDSSGHFLL